MNQRTSHDDNHGVMNQKNGDGYHMNKTNATDYASASQSLSDQLMMIHYLLEGLPMK